MTSAIVPGIHDAALADENVSVATEDAQAHARETALREGFLIGPSGGANLAAALRVARREAAAGRPAVVVTVFPDSGERYLEQSWWKRP